MNRSERMQLKVALITILIIVLFIIGIVSIIRNTSHTSQENPIHTKESVQEEVIHYENMFLMDMSDSEITVFDESKHTFAFDTLKVNITNDMIGKMVSFTTKNGIIEQIYIEEQQRINDKVVALNEETGVTLEKAGFIPFNDKVKIYILYKDLCRGTMNDIKIGYSFTDFVITNGQISAAFIVQNDYMDAIRILIKTDEYANMYHKEVVMSCNQPFNLCYLKEGKEVEIAYQADEIVTINILSDELNTDNRRVILKPSALTCKVTLHNVKRNREKTDYRGTLELLGTDQGIVVINELNLEEYLYMVVPSEMPSGYEMEALKAQAICARTYAYTHLENPGLKEFGAHMDDSTSYQVYGNIMEQSRTTEAVNETRGLVICENDIPVQTFYYSTSCGMGADEHVWKPIVPIEYDYLTARSISYQSIEKNASIYAPTDMVEEQNFSTFIKGIQDYDFEREEPWYRWTYDINVIDEKVLLQCLKDRYESNSKLILTKDGNKYKEKTIDKLGKILNISIIKRNAGGVADELLIEGEDASIKVISEYNIRYVLCDKKSNVIRQDGSKVEMKSILPSAFFVIEPMLKEKNVIGYRIYGGGFGHGAGMSQNGANRMAMAGYKADEILTFFYNGCTCKQIIKDVSGGNQ